MLTTIKARREFLSEQHQEYDYITKTGIQGLTIARESAKTDIAALQSSYEKRVGEVCARVFVVGGTNQQVKELLLSANEMEAVTVPADALYQSIARNVTVYLGEPPKLTVRAGAAIVEELARAYLRYAPDSTYPTIPMQMLEGYLGTDTEAIRNAVLNIIRTVVKNTANKPVAAIFAQDICIREALRLEVVEEPVPLVVTGLTTDDVADFEAVFFPGRPSVVVDLDKAKSGDVALKAAAKQLTKALGLEAK